MKKYLILTAIAIASLTACKTGTTIGKEDLTFPFGKPLPSPPFTGEAYLQPLIQPDTVFNFPATNNITFAPGAHSSWHRHGGMVVLVTGGIGLYQEEGKPARVLCKGDVLQIPAGVRHWHGATKDNWFSQMVIYDAAWQPEILADEDNTLTEEDYLSAISDARSESGITVNDLSMFPAPAEAITLPTFNGPIHLANTLEEPNVAGCPGLHNVVFEPGIYNAWHSHAGGQVLIVTDGIGYHQMEGQPVNEKNTRTPCSRNCLCRLLQQHPQRHCH